MIYYKMIKLLANVAAWGGRTKDQRREIRARVIGRCIRNKSIEVPKVQTDEPIYLSLVSANIQNLSFPPPAMDAERLMVVLVPEHNAMSGGIYSMFSIATHLRRIKHIHGYEVLLMTRPQRGELTYFRNTNFTNSENVYRFSQLRMCKKLKELYLHIPEYAASTFVDDMSEEMHDFMQEVASNGNLRINILNQNVQLMPEPHDISRLRELASELTQSVAHHAYFNQEDSDRYNLPTLLLPAYTDLNGYPTASFEEKEKLIIYSPDEAGHKKKCLSQLRQELPEFRLVEIRDITFDQFMDIATRCMFSITFGEGFDGYLAQPIHQGGMAFATFDEEFFPSSHFKKYFNIFETPDQMVNEICGRIRHLAAHPKEYEALNQAWVEEYSKLYSYDDYRDRIRMLAMREFELFPMINASNSNP